MSCPAVMSGCDIDGRAKTACGWVTDIRRTDGIEGDERERLVIKLIIGYVYGYDGDRQCYYFEKSPSNIANFIMLYKENANKMILTDLADRLVLNTFGEFINRCPDQELLQEIIKDLVPMQMGDKEPICISIVGEAEAQAFWDEAEQNVMDAELRMP